MLDMTGLDDSFSEMPKCSDTLVCKWRVVRPTYDAEQHRHLNKHTKQGPVVRSPFSLNGG